MQTIIPARHIAEARALGLEIDAEGVIVVDELEGAIDYRDGAPVLQTVRSPQSFEITDSIADAIAEARRVLELEYA